MMAGEYYGPSPDFSEALPVMGSTADENVRAAADHVMRHVDPNDEGLPALVRFFKNAAMLDFEAEYEALTACKHEWRQYMDVGIWHEPWGETTRPQYGLHPLGFFCIHCMERSDG